MGRALQDLISPPGGFGAHWCEPHQLHCPSHFTFILLNYCHLPTTPASLQPQGLCTRYFLLLFPWLTLHPLGSSEVLCPLEGLPQNPQSSPDTRVAVLLQVCTGSCSLWGPLLRPPYGVPEDIFPALTGHPALPQPPSKPRIPPTAGAFPLGSPQRRGDPRSVPVT